jgi:hypothetical protein
LQVISQAMKFSTGCTNLASLLPEGEGFVGQQCALAKKWIAGRHRLICCVQPAGGASSVCPDRPASTANRTVPAPSRRMTWRVLRVSTRTTCL